MQLVKCLCFLFIVCTSCRSVRQSVTLPADVNHLPIAYAVSPKAIPNDKSEPEPASATAELTLQEENKAPEKATDESSPAFKNISVKKVQSFSQLKAMAASGDIKMSRKDVKVLNKLEKKYHGNFEQFRADTFEFTTKAKIVAGVGLIGLLLAIFTGSWFGAFLFILAALGFILRFVGAIEF